MAIVHVTADESGSHRGPLVGGKTAGTTDTDPVKGADGSG